MPIVDIQFEIQYKEIRVDIIVSTPDDSMQLSMQLKGMQTTVNIIL
jgi:hypothetical protein